MLLGNMNRGRVPRTLILVLWLLLISFVPGQAVRAQATSGPPCSIGAFELGPHGDEMAGPAVTPGMYRLYIKPRGSTTWMVSQPFELRGGHRYLFDVAGSLTKDGGTAGFQEDPAFATPYGRPTPDEAVVHYQNTHMTDWISVTVCPVPGGAGSAPPCDIVWFELRPNGSEMAGPAVPPGTYRLYQRVRGEKWISSKPFELRGGHRYLFIAGSSLREDGGTAGFQEDPAFATPYGRPTPDEAVVHYQNTDLNAWIALTVCPVPGSAGSAPPCDIAWFELRPNGSEMAGPAVPPGKYRLYQRVRGEKWISSKPFELRGGHRYLFIAGSSLREEGGTAGFQEDPAFATPYGRPTPDEAVVHYQNTDLNAWIALTVCPDTGPFMPTPTGTVIDIKKGAAGCLDLIFVIDLTSSMSDDIDQVKKTAKQILNVIATGFPDFRVAIVGYRDWGDAEMFKDIPFSNSISEITAAIDGLKVQGGGDEPEAVLEALLRAIRTEAIGPWRDGCNKQIILMGDAPPHSPIPQGPDKGKTADDVVLAAEKVDPAVINSILISKSPGSFSEEARKAFGDLSARTKGTMTTADKAEEVPLKMMDMVEVIRKTGAVPPSGMGGGGGMVLPSTGIGTPLIIVLALLGACLILAIAILAIRRRGVGTGEVGGVRVDAAMTVTYSDGGTKAFRITSARTTIGRGADNRLVLNDAEVSTRHAEIIASPAGFLLRDLGSANGITLNGRPVTEAYLNVGDEIGIGTTRLVFGA